MAINDETRTTGPTVKSRVQPKASGRPVEKEYEGTTFSMTGIRGGLLYSNFMKIVLLFLIIIFAFGVGISGLFTTPNNNGTPGAVAAGPDPIARIGTEDVSREK